MNLSSKSEAVVQRQLDAYNARDLRRFLAEYADDIRFYRPPVAEPVLVGKEALGRFYATQRFNLVALHAEIVNRMVLGTKVIDHERISGVMPHSFEVAVVYEVIEGQIQRMWAFPAE